MTVYNFPTEYRRPAMSTMGYFAQNLQPILSAYIQHKTQEELLKKHVEIDKMKIKAANKEWDRRFRKTQEGKKAPEPSLGKTLYDEHGLVKMGEKGFAKIGKDGRISIINSFQADNIKNEQIAKWIADKTLIPVDANYPAGDPSFKLQDKNYYFNPERGKEKKGLSTLEQARKAFVEKKATPEQIKLLGKEPKGEPQTAKETIIQNYINKFKTPPGVMGAIQTLAPEKRRARLQGLFHTMNIERKKKRLDKNDIARIEQTVMTDLGVEIELQHGIKAARMAGATTKELIEIINAYKEK